MRTRPVLFVFALILAATAQVAPAAVSSALADCDLEMVHLLQARDARGQTFLGTVEYLAIQPFTNAYTFNVERIYAGEVPATATLTTFGCHPISGFELGGRYLVSTADIDAPDVGNTVAWLIRGKDARLQRLVEQPAPYPGRVRAVDRLAEAVNLMAPGSTGRKPTPVEYQYSVPLTVEVTAPDGCPETTGWCVRLIEITGLTDPTYHRGAAVDPRDPDDPRDLTVGLPERLPLGRFLVSASTWYTPFEQPRLTASYAYCSTEVQVTSTDLSVPLHVGFEFHGCRVSSSSGPVGVSHDDPSLRVPAFALGRSGRR